MGEALQGCLKILEEREYQIICAYFGLKNLRPMTLEEIGGTLNITRERVRQLRNRALVKMRTQCGDNLIEFSNN